MKMHFACLSALTVVHFLFVWPAAFACRQNCKLVNQLLKNYWANFSFR
ncbi:MAG: hypothetical protein ACTS6G_01410 [Candidatus Hodgkinia cicadicola]